MYDLTWLIEDAGVLIEMYKPRIGLTGQRCRLPQMPKQKPPLCKRTPSVGSLGGSHVEPFAI